MSAPFGQSPDDIREQFKALALEERAKRLAGRGPKPKQIFTPIVDPSDVISKTTLAQGSEGTPEWAGKQYDTIRWGKAYNGTRTDGDRAEFIANVKNDAERNGGKARPQYVAHLLGQVKSKYGSKKGQAEFLLNAPSAVDPTAPAPAEAPELGQMSAQIPMTGVQPGSPPQPLRSLNADDLNAPPPEGFQHPDIGLPKTMADLDSYLKDRFGRAEADMGAVVSRPLQAAFPSLGSTPQGKALFDLIGGFTGGLPAQFVQALPRSISNFNFAGDTTKPPFDRTMAALEGIVNLDFGTGGAAHKIIGTLLKDGSAAVKALAHDLKVPESTVVESANKYVADHPEVDWASHDPNATFREKPNATLQTGQEPSAVQEDVRTGVPGQTPEGRSTGQSQGEPPVQVPSQEGQQAQEVNAPTEAVPGASPPDMPLPGAEVPQTGVQGPETGNAAFEEAGTPVGGGVKGKRSGVARLIDPLDRILGIGTAVRSAWASRGSHSFDPKGWVVQLVGDTFQNIEHLAPKTGKLISQTLNRALVDAGARTARLVGTVHEAIIANYGKGYATSAEARAALGLDGTHGIVGKVRRGEALTAKESAVWKRVVASTKELGDSAADAGALVERVSGGPPNPRLKGHAVRWATDDGMKSGKVVGFDDKGNVRVSVDGVESTLPAGGRYWTRSVVEDAQYFPDVFKEGVLEALADPSSPEFRQATDHLIAIKKAKDAASAEAIIKSLVYPKATVSTPVSSSLRRPRIGNLLPESFFETDLLKVVDDHVSRASMDVASAKHFGPEYKGLADMLATVPSPTDRSAIGAMVKRAMGGKTDLSGAERAAHGLASVEGKYTALTKLGLNLSSAVNNLGQLMTNIGVHGLKSSWHGLWKVATSKAVRTDIKLSGVNQADFLALQGFADLTGPVKTVMHVAMTPFRILDSFARNTGAWAGLVAAKDAVRKVSVSGGKFKADASYRYLRDVMKFSDGDIARMKTEGMTDLDRFQAFQGGQSAQIGGRVADLPAAQHTPLGKMALRLQTFNIGQSKWLNYTLREAARGNAVPLGRLAVSSVIAGEGILQARGLIEQWARGKENEEPKKLEAAYQAFLRGDYAPVAERAMADISRSGVAGIYGVPIEAAARPWAKDSFQPPAARTLFNVVVDSSLYAEKTEGDFVAKVKAYFGNLSFKEVVALQNVWRATHGGKTFRQSNPLPDTDKKKEKK